MNMLDAIIIILVIASLLRGRQIGFVRQFFSSAGFFLGLLIGRILEPHTTALAHTQLTQAIITLTTTLGCALLFMAIGEYLSERLKQRIQLGRINKADNAFGSALAAVTTLLIVWLSAAIFISLPASNVQQTIDGSSIITALNNRLPPSSTIIGNLSRLIDPNGFPQVFTGKEPVPNTGVAQPSLRDFQPAINAVRPSVVKIEGQGCGGIVDGSGFVVGRNLIATNAHVVAGISRPYVIDDNGRHQATPIWFDPNLDFAVLRVNNLAGKVLTFDTAIQPTGTAAAVLGYPGGGTFSADGAAILDQFTATGRNIYDRGQTERAIYEIRARIIPGNSGGPVIIENGSVIGVVFAESTTYQDVGYALTAKKVVSEIGQAQRNASGHVSTGGCAQ